MQLGIQLEGLTEARAVVDSLSDQRIRNTASTALTRTARELERQWLGELFANLDRPTQRTLQATSVKPASANDLVAEVFIKDRPARPDAPSPAEWLTPQEEGGSRFVKKFERALIRQGSMLPQQRVVPGPYAELDGFGNISRSQITHVIAQLGRDFSPGYARTISTRMERRLATAARHGRQYVAFPRRTRGTPPPGVYQRDGRRLLPVFLYVSTVTYSKRIDLVDRATREGPGLLAAQFGRALGDQLMRVNQLRGRAVVEG